MVYSWIQHRSTLPDNTHPLNHALPGADHTRMHPAPTTLRARAFTLVELIAVIVVLAILAAVAVPKYFEYSTRSRAAALEGTLKVMQRALLSYNRDIGGWPADRQPRIAPAGLERYMEPGIWTALTPLGTTFDYENWASGQWEWPTGVIGVTVRSGYGGTLTSDATTAMTLIEQHIDDANPQTGNLRTYSHGYFFKIADQ